MIYLLAFVPVLAFWLLMLRIVTRPNANYVGIPPTRMQILMRSMALNFARFNRQVGASLIGALEASAESIKRFGRAWEAARLLYEEWPVHQPAAPDAPIPGRHWYAGCEPGGDWDYELRNFAGSGPRVNPTTGICEGCGERACPSCGRENCPDHG